ncbi:OmcA/MtrC family decaheme c-type cytochrome [Shewanella salipaludis]|uniref:OmcA/MtrC family decaheme c-type cytochrome n=1 Tax=Shewanella salipaludis TaxID=2723052 RepID=A0A972G8U7_9GAMM|nr:OmcA/MtrC family decaheme c-type cytochrome [Shewanella salipaludis]NMH66660.1 OmcA/MtrC family decaheme c-type cytochrome [Shewanella salipaludis]
MKRTLLLGRMGRIAALLTLLVLFGCSDGKTGPAGPAGPEGPAAPPPIEVSENPTALVPTVTSVTINSAPVVEFNVVDQDGLPYVDLPSIRFTLAKLLPSKNGDSSAWQSYINRTEAPNGVGPGTQETIQATSDSGGTLENHQDGSYTYTFGTDITAITSPLAVVYEPELTHRLGMQLSGNDQPVANTVFDFRPADGETMGLDSREVVKIENCNSCHGKLALHGGGRIETKLCVTCHNPGSTDANSGNTVDFKVMIHKIHRGEALPSVVQGGEYAIYGFRDTKHDYSDVVLPQDIRNCSKCHDANDAATPEAIGWQERPTIQACGSCHDDVDFAKGVDGGHPGGVMTDNADCTVCHKEGGFAGSVVASHATLNADAAKDFKWNILNVSNTAPGNFPTVTFSVVNPNQDNASYDIKTHPAFSANARLSIDLAWDTKDYHNTGSGSGAANVISFNALTTAVANADGSFSATSTVALPATAVGTGAVAIEGRPAADFDGDNVYSDRLPVKSEVGFFPITDSAAIPRRQSVDNAKCNNCHQQLSLHGGSRNGEVQLCVMCHNPNNTDISRRPADPAMALDGLKERSIDFKRLIHGIHGAAKRENDFIVYGFGNSVHNFGEVSFPGIISNCETCHVDEAYKLPLAPGVLASTLDTGPLLADPSDDVNVSPSAAVCSSCHDSILAKAHMTQNGGASFDTSQADIDNFSVIETCQYCHGAGGIADVKTVHKIQ